MTKISTSFARSNPFPLYGKVFRLVSTILLASTLLACTASPTKKSAGNSAAQEAGSSRGVSSAAAMYNTRNYPGAVREFNAIITDKGASANNRRLAHLGKAMVYLGNDKNWHSIENAKMSLISAGQVAPEDGEEFNVETDMLMDAISDVIGTESKYEVLVAKSNAYGKQSVGLESELEAMTAERDELLKEQKRLNDALEKLKKLTLGN